MRSFALFSVALSAPIALCGPAMAQEEPPVVADDRDGQYEENPNEIVVIASRLYGQIDAPQPPIMTLDEADIASYGVSSIDELLSAVSPQTNSGRGRGEGHPVILINGQRIGSFREFRNIPPEAIRRMEVLPEEVALRFGYPANQRVVNFILKENFASRTIDLEYAQPSRGGFSETEAEASLLTISGPRRLNLNVQSKDSSMLTERERGIRQEAGTVSAVPGDPDPADFRSLVSDTRELSATASWSTGIGEGARSGSFSLNGQVLRSDSRSLSGLNSVVLVPPGGNADDDGVLRTLGDPLGRRSRTVTAQGGAAFNKGLGGWQLSATLDAANSEIETRIDRRAIVQPLIDAAAAGTLAPDGPLPALANPGFDLTRTRNRTLTSLVTLSGSPFRLPAGEVSVTAKGGFAYTGIRSSDTRALGMDVALDRGDLNAGLNVALPIASRRDDVLAGIGDLSLNFSAGLNRLSDFGTLTDWSAGLTWSPLEKLGIQVSYLVNEAAPSLSDLGNPQIQNFNVPVYDFARGETVLITTSSGGNPDLRREVQRDLKIGGNWELPFLKNSNLVVEYFRNRSDDVTQPFPLLTPEIEAAFPGRVVRDADGRLVSIDRRPVTFDKTSASRLRWGLNVSGTIGKPQAGGGDGAGPAGGARGPGGGPRMGGGNRGQGRWNLAVFHTIRFDEAVLIAPGGPRLDLLDGDALTDGGVARHAIEFEGGAFHKGFGLRLNGSWTAPTRLNASTGSDLRFGAVFNLDLRAFVNFDQKPKVIEAVPFLKGARLSLEVKNVFNSIQRVTDPTGEVPLSYQAAYLDPRGRVFGIDFRKLF